MKILRMLTMLFLTSGTVHADRTPSNLSSFKATDFCVTLAAVYVDSVQDKDEQERIQSLIDDQDNLSGLNFGSTPLANCKIGSYIYLQAAKTARGEYIYTHEIEFFLIEALAATGDDLHRITSAQIYNIGSYGLATSLDQLKTRNTQSVLEFYKSFVSDWRSVH